MWDIGAIEDLAFFLLGEFYIALNQNYETHIKRNHPTAN